MSELSRITGIMARHGATCTPEEFHRAVNVTFHKYESEQYDVLHKDMWESLPAQVELLASDALSVEPTLGEKLQLLDIGCGTGLATDCLLRTPLGKRVASVDLLDTSSAMLARAVERGGSWGVPVQAQEGLVEDIQGEGLYDVIITCSVLHHVPDLVSFSRAVRRLQKPNGVFIHLQDPNGDALNDPELKQRMASASSGDKLPEWLQRLAPRRILGRVYREITGTQHTDYISRTNKELIANGVIRDPLRVPELFAVTDIHVHDDTGISVRMLKTCLTDYELIRQRTYGFFGQLRSSLPSSLKSEEEKLIQANALNGFHVAASWKLRQ